MTRRKAPLAALCLALAACARAPVAPPEQALRRYLQTLRNDKPDSPDRRALAEALASALDATTPALERSTTVITPAGLSATLIPDGGTSRLAAPPAFAEGAASPAELLARLEDALTRRDIDALLRLCSPRLAATLRGLFTDRARALGEYRGKHPTLPTTPGRLRYDSGRALDLVEDHGRWQLGDLN